MTSRRGLLKIGGVAAFGAAAVTASGVAAATSSADQPFPDQVEFHGEHQAGIATPAPARLAFASYDVVTSGTTSRRRAALIALLKDWTAAAAAMTAGHPVPGDNTSKDAPRADTGEAYGSKPSNLTITIGFGPSLFDDRFGLSGGRPTALADLPHLPPASLDPDCSDGDLCVQACSDDPVVAFHAIRNLARIGRGTVVMRWSQLGFGKAISTGRDSSTPRNLMGFKDGTRNIDTADDALMNAHVWVGGETDQSWDAWRQLSGGTPDSDAHRSLGPRPLVGSGSGLRPGQMAYQKDPRTQFVALQRRLGRGDALNEYIQHVGSGLFACPPGVTGAGDYWGSTLIG